MNIAFNFLVLIGLVRSTLIYFAGFVLLATVTGFAQERIPAFTRNIWLGVLVVYSIMFFVALPKILKNEIRKHISENQ